MAEYSENSPESRAAEIAGMSAAHLALGIGEEYAAYCDPSVDLHEASGPQGLSYGLEFLLGADEESLRQGGYAELALLVSEFRTRVSRLADGQVQRTRARD